MRKTLLFLAALALSSYCQPQSKAGAIGPSAVWQPPPSFRTGARAACGNTSPGRKDSDCLINQMSKAGAPVDAVNFTRKFYKESRGDVGILTGFNHVGPVDIAWVFYPTHNPPNYGLFLVNGDPKFVNAEDLKQLDQKAMLQSFQYQSLQSQFPKVGLWPGDRDGQTWPNSQAGVAGGLQFIVGYPLRNGCQTCAHAGFALFTWNFTADGKFTGTSFMGLTPAPLTNPTPSQQ
jgi:hypothetical protein